MANRPTNSDNQRISWPPTPPLPPGASVGQRVERSLAEAIRRFLELFDEPIAEFVAWCFRLFLKIFERSAGDYVNPLLDRYISQAPAGDPLKEVMQKLRNPPGFAGAALLASIGGGAASAGLLSFLEPFFEVGRQMAYKGNPSKVLDPASSIAAGWRGELTQNELNDYLERFGFDIHLHTKLQEIARPRMDGSELGRWYLRDRERESAYREELSKRGFTEEDIDRAVELLNTIPPVGDIIRMSVREAFKEDVAAAWGLDQDFDVIVEEWAEKLGLDPYWVNKYWRSHWELPSILMGFQMLHRGAINMDELNNLLRALDVMPGWRDKLVEISYNPYTRVDTRRMYGMNILNEDQVKQAYKAQGYDEEHAENMTAFTIGYFIETEREATKTDILTAYFEGPLTREEAGELLLAIGYREPFVETYLLATDYRIEQRRRNEEEDEADDLLQAERTLTKADILSYYKTGGFSEEEAREFLLALNYPTNIVDIYINKIDYEKTQEIIQKEVDTTHTLYVNGDIEVTDVHERLGKYALPAEQVSNYLLIWGIERDRRTERPSASQFLTFYMNGRIEEDALRDHLARHKYSDEYIDLYVANANYLILEREKKEFEREQKEQERIAAAEFKTDRMVSLQELNVRIAEWRVYIAELKTMMLKVVPPGTKQQLTTQIRVKEEEIAALNVKIAEDNEALAQAIELAPTLEEPEDLEQLQTLMLSIKTEIAGYEVDIADLREEIAGIRTTISTVVEPAEKLAYTEQISIAREEIAKLQLQKAELPVVPLTE